MQTLFGQKTEQLQRFLEDGRRVPVTVLRVPETSIIQQKTSTTDGYSAMQVGFGTKKENKLNKPMVGHLKKSGAKAPLFLREIRLTDDTELAELGSTLKVEEILEPGDIVWVTGTSKGKGFAGGVKRYGFRGGPKTHGQSDRERAPGSIGQTTTPGRVYKGKRMAGNMGNEQVTIKNLMVVSVDPEEKTIMLAGLVPGILGSYVKVVKMGSKKKFSPLLKNPVEQAEADAIAAKEAEEAAKAAEIAAREAAKAEEIAAKEAAKNQTEVEKVAAEESVDAPTSEDTETPAGAEAETDAEEKVAEAASVEPAVAEVQAEEAETDAPVAQETASPVDEAKAADEANEEAK